MSILHPFTIFKWFLSTLKIVETYKARIEMIILEATDTDRIFKFYHVPTHITNYKNFTVVVNA